MRWLKPFRKLVAATVLVATIAFGIGSATHAHHISTGDDCATCRVVHTSALVPAASPLGLPLLAHEQFVPAREDEPALAPRREGASPRGPPSASC